MNLSALELHDATIQTSNQSAGTAPGEHYPIELEFPDIRAFAEGNAGVPYVYTFDSGVPGPPAVCVDLTILPGRLCRSPSEQGRGVLTSKVIRLTARAWIAPCAAVLMTASTALAQVPESDVLAPGGVTVGMTPEEARDALAAAGWGQKSKCEYHLGPQGMPGSPRVNFFTASQGGSCKDGEPIRHIQYKYRGERAIGGAAAVDRLNAEIGGPAACKDPVTERTAQCAWNIPAEFPLVNLIDLDVAAQFLTLHVYAVPNLDRPHTPSKPLDAAFDPMTPAIMTDPLAPGGLKVEMPLDEAEQVLAAAGYTKSRSSISCTWSLERKYELETQITLQTKNELGQTTRCVEGEPIHNITFRKIEHPAARRRAGARGYKTGLQAAAPRAFHHGRGRNIRREDRADGRERTAGALTQRGECAGALAGC